MGEFDVVEARFPSQLVCCTNADGTVVVDLVASGQGNVGCGGHTPCNLA